MYFTIANVLFIQTGSIKVFPILLLRLSTIYLNHEWKFLFLPVENCKISYHFARNFSRDKHVIFLYSLMTISRGHLPLGQHLIETRVMYENPSWNSHAILNWFNLYRHAPDDATENVAANRWRLQPLINFMPKLRPLCSALVPVYYPGGMNAEVSPAQGSSLKEYWRCQKSSRCSKVNLLNELCKQTLKLKFVIIFVYDC